MTRAFSCIRLFSRITYGLLAAIAVAGGSASAPADDYPTRTLRAVVPFAPAGVMDLVARIVLERERLLAARIAQWSDVIKISGIRIDER
jgi:hypothetical protein